jgi:hypothetical protein
MQLSQKEFKVEQNLQPGEKFSIKNQAYIYSILRDKIYSNPIQSIVREVICNGRDAARKNGGTCKVELDNSFRVIDTGEGISPELMRQVVTVYGESTKTGSNLETGGFGLGFKSPFAYTTQFIVRTAWQGNTYTYLLSLDESGQGEYRLIGQYEGGEGTIVEVPVKSGDRTYFDQFIKYYTHYMGEIEGPTIQPLLEGTGWAIYENHHDILVDQVRYESNHSTHYGKYSPIFKNGELEFSISRENIRWKNDSQLESIKQNYSREIVEKMEVDLPLKDWWSIFKKCERLTYKGIPIESYKLHSFGQPWKTSGFNLNYQIVFGSETKVKRYANRTGASVQWLPDKFRPYIEGVDLNLVKFTNNKSTKYITYKHVNRKFKEIPENIKADFYCLDTDNFLYHLGFKVITIAKSNQRRIRHIPYFGDFIKQITKGVESVSLVNWQGLQFLSHLIPMDVLEVPDWARQVFYYAGKKIEYTDPPYPLLKYFRNAEDEEVIKYVRGLVESNQ